MNEQTTINVHERLEQLMARRKVDLTKDVRFRKLRTIKWHEFTASTKNDSLNGWL